MIEKTAQDFLIAKTGLAVYSERPANSAESDMFVTIEKTGSSEKDHLCSSTLAFQSYAPSMYAAMVLNELVKTAVKSMVELPGVTAVRFNSDYNFTDTASKRYRYQAVFDIYHYEEI